MTGTGYSIMIFDQTTGSRLVACSVTSSCQATVSIPNGGAHTYITYVGDLTNTPPPTQLQATSSTVTIQRTPWTVGLTASALELSSTGSSTLTATSNQPVTGTGYSIMIFDQTTGSRLVACSTTSSCQATVSILQGDPHTYIAYVGDLTNTPPPTQLQATSGKVIIHRAPWSITLAGTGSTLTATTNQTVSGTGYSIMIFDQTTGARLASCQTTTTCSTQIDTVALAGHQTIAYVGFNSNTAPPNGEQANSNGYGIVDSLDLAAAAALLANVSVPELCAMVLLSPVKTNINHSTVSDQYFECDLVAQGSGTIAKALAAIAATAGGAGVIYWLVHQYTGTAPATAPPQPGPDPNAPPDPAPNPLPPAWPVGQLVARLVAQNANLTNSDANTIATQCLWLTTKAGLDNPFTKCNSLPIFVSGVDVASAAMHDIQALERYPAWVLVHREQSSIKPGSGWASNLCPGKTSSQNCDEYPMFGMEEGGPAASVYPDLLTIDAVENQRQGTRYSSFIAACSMKTGTPNPPGNSIGGDAFLGIPLPPSWGIPSITSLCNGKTS